MRRPTEARYVVTVCTTLRFYVSLAFHMPLGDTSTPYGARGILQGLAPALVVCTVEGSLPWAYGPAGW